MRYPGTGVERPGLVQQRFTFLFSMVGSLWVDAANRFRLPIGAGLIAQPEQQIARLLFEKGFIGLAEMLFPVARLPFAESAGLLGSDGLLQDFDLLERVRAPA